MRWPHSKKDRIKVIVDTREKEGYSFDPERFETIHGALQAGDYSLEGHEESVAVERKTLDDFVSTVIRSRERFTRELEKLERYEVSCIVIEADLSDILAERYRAGAHPNSVLGSALSIILDHGVPIYFCSNRQAARQFVEGFLLMYHRKVKRQCEEIPTLRL